MPVSKSKRHRRPHRSHRNGPARRFIRQLPKPVEELVVVQNAAEFIDQREEDARRSAHELEKTAKKQLQLAVKFFDGWLEKIGLMRVSNHEAELRRARAKKAAKTSSKKRSNTKSSGAMATA